MVTASSTDKAWIASKVKAVFNECAGNTRVREDVWRLLFFCEQFIDAHDENGDPLPNQRSEESYSVEELQVVIQYLIGKLSKMDASLLVSADVLIYLFDLYHFSNFINKLWLVSKLTTLSLKSISVLWV